MANFNITVGEEIIIPYIGINGNITKESCNTVIESYAANIYDIDPESYDDNIIYLLSSYSGAAWKTLTISNIVYSHANDFYLEYLGIPMTINTVYNIDVTLLPIGINIPNLLFKNNIVAGNLTPKNISYDISITDINDNVWNSVSSDIDMVLTSCLTPVEPVATDVTANAVPPTETIEFTVTTAPYSNINFQYIVVDKSTGGFSGIINRLSSAHGAYLSKLTSISNTVGTTFNVIDNSGPTGIVHYQFIITTNPPNPPGLESESFTEVNLHLRNNANNNTIQTFTCWIGATTVP